MILQLINWSVSIRIPNQSDKVRNNPIESETVRIVRKRWESETIRLKFRINPTKSEIIRWSPKLSEFRTTSDYFGLCRIDSELVGSFQIPNLISNNSDSIGWEIGGLAPAYIRPITRLYHAYTTPISRQYQAYTRPIAGL